MSAIFTALKKSLPRRLASARVSDVADLAQRVFEFTGDAYTWLNILIEGLQELEQEIADLQNDDSGATPTGAAGGDLSGTYPNPTVPGLVTLAATISALASAVTTALGLKADKSTAISAGDGLDGGGDLSANRTLTVEWGSGNLQVRHGDDAAYTNARTPSGAAGGGLGGTYPNPTVTRDASLDVYVPTEAEVLAYSGLLFYYDADHVSLSGSAITAFTDRSPSGNNSQTQSTGAKRPTQVTNTLNGLAVARFAAGQCIQTPSLGLATFTAFVVYSGVTASGIVYEQSVDANSNDGCYLTGTTGNTCFVSRGANKSGKDTANANWLVGEDPGVVSQQFRGVHRTHYMISGGNTQTVNVNGTATGNPGTGTATAVINIGARNNAASAGLTGDLAAIAFFTPALSGMQRQGVARMLGLKYGVGTT